MHHPKVRHVHTTGSAATHDAIVFGTGTEGAGPKKAGTPLLDKPATSELGGVSPMIVLPGGWSEADLRYQAEHIATRKLHNNGYNYVASQAAVVSADWPQKDRFLAHLRAGLADAPARPPHYPGSDDRGTHALDTYSDDAERLGAGRVLITGLAPAEPGPALTTEHFAPRPRRTETPR
ncbi:aldehyde dehydrogenase family protein [Streptomyces sp. NPDC002784]